MDWLEVEKNLNNIIQFLESNINLSPYRQNNPINCKDCLFRYIAVLISSQKIKVRKVKYKDNKIWKCKNNLPKFLKNKKTHGSKWHNNLMLLIEEYFKYNDFKVKNEPNLHYGKADLFIPKIKIYIEVGTIDLYKLYYNLLRMKDCKIVIVPSDNYLISFEI